MKTINYKMVEEFAKAVTQKPEVAVKQLEFYNDKKENDIQTTIKNLKNQIGYSQIVKPKRERIIELILTTDIDTVSEYLDSIGATAESVDMEISNYTNVSIQETIEILSSAFTPPKLTTKVVNAIKISNLYGLSFVEMCEVLGVKLPNYKKMLECKYFDIQLANGKKIECGIEDKMKVKGM